MTISFLVHINVVYIYKHLLQEGKNIPEFLNIIHTLLIENNNVLFPSAPPHTNLFVNTGEVLKLKKRNYFSFQAVQLGQTCLHLIYKKIKFSLRCKEKLQNSLLYYRYLP